MKEILTFEFMIGILRSLQEWSSQCIPEHVIPWIQASFLLVIIMVPMVICAYIAARSGSSKGTDVSPNKELDDFKSPKVDDPVSMVRAFDSIKEWTEEYGIPWDGVRLIYRQNQENILARFHLVNVTLKNEEIDSFLMGKLTDYKFEGLFRAKILLSGTRGSLNVFRSPEGGTCIDALIRTDRKQEIEKARMKAEIKRLDALLGTDKRLGPPDLIDTVIQSYATLFRVIRNWLNSVPKSSPKPAKKPIPTPVSMN